MTRFPVHGWWLGALSFLVSYLAHVWTWRRSPPQRDVLALGIIMLLIPGLALIVAGISSALVVPALVYLVLVANYLAIYPAFQASSPTIHLMALLFRHSQGLNREQIRSYLEHPQLVADRMADLSAAGLVSSESARGNGSPRLSRTGAWLAGVFIAYRRFLGLPVGEG